MYIVWLLLSTGQQHNLQTHFLQGGGSVAGHMTHQGYTASNHGQPTQPPCGYLKMAPAVPQGGESVNARVLILHTCKYQVESHVTYT